jgi:predicted amidophosphoribosyltransferase
MAGPALSTRPTPCPPGLPPAWTVAAYDGAVRRAVVSWKDEGRHDLAGPLSVGLTVSVLAALAALAPGADLAPAAALRAEGVDRDGGDVWLVPMPSRPSARRARGASPVRDLAVRAATGARREGWPVRVVTALRHRRAVVDQAGLDAVARRANLEGALEIRPAWRATVVGRPCLLVDDVVTTGSTLAEAAEVVRRAGGHPFGVAVLAATARTPGRRLPKPGDED